jgi:hypothetical protein
VVATPGPRGHPPPGGIADRKQGHGDSQHITRPGSIITIRRKRPVRPATATFRLMPISSMSYASSPVWSSWPSPRRRAAAASAPRWGWGLVDVLSVRRCHRGAETVEAWSCDR